MTAQIKLNWICFPENMNVETKGQRENTLSLVHNSEVGRQNRKRKEMILNEEIKTKDCNLGAVNRRPTLKERE